MSASHTRALKSAEPVTAVKPGSFSFIDQTAPCGGDRPGRITGVIGRYTLCMNEGRRWVGAQFKPGATKQEVGGKTEWVPL